jgi:hypothetical protein
MKYFLFAYLHSLFRDGDTFPYVVDRLILENLTVFHTIDRIIVFLELFSLQISFVDPVVCIYHQDLYSVPLIALLVRNRHLRALLTFNLYAFQTLSIAQTEN